MFREENVEIVPLTLELAQRFASMPAHKGERPRREEHVQELFSKWERGIFHSPDWAQARTPRLGNTWFRTNGQHSSPATVLAFERGLVPPGARVIIRSFVCDDVSDLPDLFCQFDPKRGARTDLEIIMAGARMIPALDDLKPTPIGRALSGIATWLSQVGTHNGKISAEYKRGLLTDYIDFILWSRQFTGRKLFKPYGVLAALSATYAADRERATSFWNAVDDGDHHSKDHPVRRLNRFLDLLTTDAHNQWSTRAVLAKCVHAWNAGDGSTNLNYIENAPLPKPRGPQKVKEAA